MFRPLYITTNRSHVLDGRFGAMMSVALVNEGPVTLTLDSRKFEYINIAPKVKDKKKHTPAPKPVQPDGIA
jgi:D-tyrosyl-tRNA(Tyr) deacylase